MRIMLDTNVLVSSVLFPNSKTSLAVSLASQKHTLLVCTYVLDEVQSVFARKFPDKTIVDCGSLLMMFCKRQTFLNGFIR